MTDPIKKYNNEEVWNAVRIIKMWHRDIKWANVRKNGTNRHLGGMVATNFNLNIMQYLWSPIR